MSTPLDMYFMWTDGLWRASSVYRNNYTQFGVHLAQDGQLSTSSSGLFRSERELYPWMQITLPIAVNLTSVTVVNRLDGAVARMLLEVRAGLDEVPLGVDESILDVNEVCGRVSGGGVHDVIQCDKPILSQYLTVQMLQKGSLVVNEIRVNSGRLLMVYR